MSEPMSNHEIEDVLSSIRRLVSEDLRPNLRQRDMADLIAPPVPEKKSAGKLLLTPAFRVVEAPEAALDGPEELSPPLQNSSAEDVGTDSSQPVFAAGEDLAIVQDDEPGPDLGEWSADSEPQDWADHKMAEDAAAHVPTTPVEDVVAKLGAAVTAHDEEWESPVGDVEALSSNGWTQPGWTQTADASQNGADSSEAGFAFVHRARATEVQPEDFIESSSDAFAQDESAAVDWQDPEPEGNRPAQPRIVTPPQDQVPDWADAAEAAVMEDLARNTEQEAAALFDEGEGGMSFDEEVLRDLVRDIIREELSGTLGERITRNVRKLVRAEIARALAVREFE